MTGVQIDGASKMRRTLKAAGADLSELKEVNRRAAQYVMPEAVRTAPYQYGALASTLRVSATVSAGTIKGGNKRKGDDGVPYSEVIHYGWPARGIKPQPWLSRAAQTTEPLWIKTYEAEMHAAIMKVSGK